MHDEKQKKRVIAVAILLSVFTAAAVPNASAANQDFYVGPNNGLWSSGSNWSGNVQPPSGDDAVVGQFVPSRTGDVNVTFDSNYSSAQLNSVILDESTTNGRVIVNQTASGSFMSAGSESIGSTATGSVYNQSGGTNVGSVALGYTAQGTGTYNFSGGQMNADVTVGSVGTGLFNQTGGSVQTRLVLRRGSYTLSVGSLTEISPNNTGGEQIGNSGFTATFTQTGGTHAVTAGFNGSLMTIGLNGTYALSAGSSTVGYSDAFTKNPGSISNAGTFNLSGGTLQVLNANAPAGTFTNSGQVHITGSPTLGSTFNVINSEGFSITGSTIPSSWMMGLRRSQASRWPRG